MSVANLSAKFRKSRDHTNQPGDSVALDHDVVIDRTVPEIN